MQGKRDTTREEGCRGARDGRRVAREQGDRTEHLHQDVVCKNEEGAHIHNAKYWLCFHDVVHNVSPIFACHHLEPHKDKFSDILFVPDSHGVARDTWKSAKKLLKNVSKFVRGTSSAEGHIIAPDSVSSRSAWYQKRYH